MSVEMVVTLQAPDESDQASVGTHHLVDVFLLLLRDRFYPRNGRVDFGKGTTDFFGG